LTTLLDILRIVAALAVFLGHTNFIWFFGTSSIGPQNGQDYVVIFFVLSGFVIAWSTDLKKNLSFNQYVFDRLTRLWSVALPALAIGFCLDHFGSKINQQNYETIISTSHIESKFAISAFFLHESWFYSIRPGSNGPFWSLSYEFFYYLLFGSIVLLPTTSKKIIGTVIATLVAGPKVLLLFPCWIIGVLAYHLCRFKFRRSNIYLSTALTVTSGWYLFVTLKDRWSNWNPWDIPGLGLPPLFYSAKFLDDYLIAVALAAFIVGLSYWLTLEKKKEGPVSATIRHIAGCSFSLYAIHFPVMAFIGSMAASSVLEYLDIIGAILLVAGFCYLFSFIFERPLKFYRSCFLSFFPQFAKRCGIRS
jgi:peptidoglycan/LPS O-acetylase OafA/YrhL